MPQKDEPEHAGESFPPRCLTFYFGGSVEDKACFVYRVNTGILVFNNLTSTSNIPL